MRKRFSRPYALETIAKMDKKEMYSLWKEVCKELVGLMRDTFTRWRRTAEFQKYSVLQLKMGANDGVSEENRDGLKL